MHFITVSQGTGNAMTSLWLAAAFYQDRYQRTYEVNMSTESITNFKVTPGEALNI